MWPVFLVGWHQARANSGLQHLTVTFLPQHVPILTSFLGKFTVNNDSDLCGIVSYTVLLVLWLCEIVDWITLGNEANFRHDSQHTYTEIINRKVVPLRKYHVMKISVRDEGKWLVSGSGRFIPTGRFPVTHWIGEWVGLWSNMNVVTKRKICAPAGHRMPVVNAEDSYFTDWASGELISEHQL